MTDPLARLFGSPARVRLMRLFLFNPRDSFLVTEAAARAGISKKIAAREIGLLHLAGLVRRTSRKSAPYFSLNGDFAYRAALQALLFNAQVRATELPNRVRTAGAMRFIVVAGAFVGDFDAALDILFVGERINERSLRAKVKSLESELGRQLRYAVIATPDFFYRLNISDKLLRDVLDYPHTIVLDRLNIGLK